MSFLLDESKAIWCGFEVTAGKWLVVGQGLAGSCMAWELWRRGVDFRWVDRGTGGSSRVAAGMINPITGKNFEPSWRIAEFLPGAVEFYREVEAELCQRFWYPLPVLRLAGSEKEWRKISGKLTGPDIAPWVVGECTAPNGWEAAVLVKGGGRLDVKSFIDGTRDFFRERGKFEEGEVIFDSGSGRVWCEGATGLITGRYGNHRCAKGEILTIRATGWDESHARVGGGGWLLPMGGGIFKTGATYEWDELDEKPTEAGRAKVEAIAGRLGGADFEVIGHEAGVRPILRRSQPLIGPVGDGDWMFNGLGSKGSLYAPGMAKRLTRWMLDGEEPEPEVDLRVFLQEDG